MLKHNVRDRHSFPWLEELGGKLHSLACDAGLIVRRTRSFSAVGFLLAILKAVCPGNASFNRIACSLSQSETRSLSRQAVHSRMKKEAVGFLDAVLDHIVSHPLLLRSGGNTQDHHHQDGGEDGLKHHGLDHRPGGEGSRKSSPADIGTSQTAATADALLIIPQISR